MKSLFFEILLLSLLILICFTIQLNYNFIDPQVLPKVYGDDDEDEESKDNDEKNKEANKKKKG